MKEAGLRGRACVLPGILAGLGMVGMGLVSDNVVRADVTTITDTLNITVQETCTFRNTTNETYTGSAANGAEVENFKDSGVHTFYLFCNSNDGYTVTATPHDLEPVDSDMNSKITYTDNYVASGQNGLWTAEISTTESGVTTTSPVPVGGDVVIESHANSSANTSFTATYSAYVGTVTSAGTYRGTIEYQLASLSGTTGGNTHSDNTSNTDTEDPASGSGETPGQETGGGSGNENTGGEQSGGNSNENTGGGTDNANNSNNTNSLTPTNNISTLNTTNHTTYNTYNTYSTTNYGSATTPVSMPSAVATTTGDSADSSTTDDTATTPVADNANTATTNYQKPLGVTSSTSTKKMDNESTMDPMPIVATGAITAAVVAGAALASSGRKEEK